MLADEGYSFTSITPATHARVVRSEELDKPAYRHVERIAAVGAIIAKAH
jgi:hypothetical protein